MCASPGFRNVGTVGYCAAHLAELYAGFDPAVFGPVGVGLPGRTTDPNDLSCIRCGATWVGLIGEDCFWCWRMYGQILDHQAERVLQPPEPTDDREAALAAWAKRLAVAVKGGIVTETQARRALALEMGSDAVAV
ncbi:MAG: hypothetical protein ACO3S5_08310 [Ilumatobacteraceae bacterium]